MRAKAEKKQKSFGGIARLTLFAVFFILIFALVGGVILLSAYSEFLISKYRGTTAIYQKGIDGLDDTTTEYVTLENMYRDGYLYVCMDDVAQMCEMTCVGDYETRTYFPVDDPEQIVTFYFGSDTVTVNGENYVMNGDMFERGGKIYIPASFLTHYASGINFYLGENKRGTTVITLCRTSMGVKSDVLGNTVQIYEPIKYSAGRSEPLTVIKQGSVFSSALPPSTVTPSGDGTTGAQTGTAQGNTSGNSSGGTVTPGSTAGTPGTGSASGSSSGTGSASGSSSGTGSAGSSGGTVTPTTPAPTTPATPSPTESNTQPEPPLTNLFDN